MWQLRTAGGTHPGPKQGHVHAGACRAGGHKLMFALASLVLASVLGTLWAWFVWIVIGGIAGAIADQVVQGNKLGILGNIIVGIVGGLLGGFILGLFGIDVNGIFWTFIT